MKIASYSGNEHFWHQSLDDTPVEALLAEKQRLVSLLRGPDTPQSVLDQLWNIDCELTGRNKLIHAVLRDNFPAYVPQPTSTKPKIVGK
jgi:hypothetical protein